MRKELVEQFDRRWNKWFKGLHQPMSQSCGDGWFNLLWRLCEDIDRLLCEPNDFVVNQVKEKFGGLRFYCGPATEEIWNRIEQAEQESYKTCEKCGSIENVTTEGSWITTLCKKCRNKTHD